MAEQNFKRQTAFKLRIGDIIKGKPVMENNEGAERFKFLELGSKQVVRVNLVVNVIDKYETEASQGETPEQTRKKYLSLTIDDASGQLRVKSWGDDATKFSSIVQGNTVIVIGTLRFYNNEVYINPEIIRQVDPKYLLVRKLELDSEKPKEVNKEEILAIKDQIISMIKAAEADGGIDTERLVLELNASPELINQEIQKMLEEGLAFEPRPGKIRYLG